MSKLDDALREALRRQEAPDGFEQRLMAKLELRRTAPAEGGWFGGWFRMPRVRWAMAFAALALFVGGVQYGRWRAERERGEQAKQQYLNALRIAGGKLRAAQEGVQRATRIIQN